MCLRLYIYTCLYIPRTNTTLYHNSLLFHFEWPRKYLLKVLTMNNKLLTQNITNKKHKGVSMSSIKKHVNLYKSDVQAYRHSDRYLKWYYGTNVALTELFYKWKLSRRCPPPVPYLRSNGMNVNYAYPSTYI